MDHSEGPTVRRSRGVSLPPVRADRVRRRDLYRELRAAVLEGVLAPGERLPSSRQAAADYGVSRGLVEAMSGTLEPEDTPGGGLTMVLSLPAAPDVAAQAEPGRRERTVRRREGETFIWLGRGVTRIWFLGPWFKQFPAAVARRRYEDVEARCERSFRNPRYLIRLTAAAL